ncbi:MAG: GGDEF domain-containing protein [Candidatus Competibacteraceae bacterium]|nr:GGDEF domain-containing protein [Candidatus Competibacteraceae bacterium]
MKQSTYAPGSSGEQDHARREDLIERLRYCPDLPTLPIIALQILELGRNPQTGIADVAKLVSLDPALSVKLLKLANSPLYGLRRRTHNLRQALSLLGLNATLSLALGFSLTQGLRSTSHQGLDTDRYWRRSIIAAVICRTLGERLGMASLEELFLAALLQDIGMLALDSLMPQEYGRLVAQAEDHERLVEAEHRTFGADHAEVGAWLLAQWNLPEYLQLAVCGSNDPAQAQMPGDLLPIVPCVALAGRMADIWIEPEEVRRSAQAARKARDWLKLTEEDYHALLVSVSKVLPETLKLFDVQPLDPMQLQGILQQARELQAFRTARQMEEVHEASQRTAILEGRTEQLEQYSHLDPLTGLRNRGFLDRVLPVEFTNATERGWPLSVAFIDLDHFKGINDRYGHDVGDQVLKAVARLLTENLRQTDLVVRYGGEEFVVVLPGTGQDSARSLLDRLLQTIRHYTCNVDEGQQLRLTTSVGLATHMSAGQRFEDHQALLRAADQALYLAKHQGRDRLVVQAA